MSEKENYKFGFGFNLDPGFKLGPLFRVLISNVPHAHCLW